MRLLLALVAGVLLLELASCTDTACSGHGTLGPDGVCACENPVPNVGDSGWTGHNCSLQVFGGQADGADLTASCSASGCGHLESGQWQCFALKFAWDRSDDPWNYLTLQLHRTSEEGDPDLFGIFFGGKRGVVHPNTTAKGYDFQETSSGVHPVAVKKVKRADFGADHDYEGAYLCVRAYASAGAVSYSLRASLDRCPATFDNSGTKLMCSTPPDAPEAERRFSECTASGECVCTGPWAKPVPEVHPGLGFEDCSARVDHLGLEDFADNSTFVGEHQWIAADAWRFYSFKLHERDYQVVVNVAGEGNSSGYQDMWLKWGAPPGSGPHEYDIRPDWNAALEDRLVSASIDPTREQYRTGAWYVGVLGDHAADSNFTITINKYECPLNCSGHGECLRGEQPTDRKCKCFEGYGGLDCSRTTTALSFGTPITHRMRAFEYDYYEMPPPTEGMRQGTVEVSVEATFFSFDYAHHLNIFPAVLLAPSNGSTFPSASAFALRLVMDQQNTTRRLSLCPSQLASGDWKLAVYNPIGSIAYNLTIDKHGRCLNNCSDHGTCNTDGVCECMDNWWGGDCSVSADTSCLAGTRRAAKRPDQHGVCWQECTCSDDESGKQHCSFGEGCADFTCDEAPEGELPLRRKGNGTECVQDQCRKDEWVQTKTYVCLRNCTCPADGSACTLDAECSGSHRVEINSRRGVSGGAVFGWVLFSLLLGAAVVLGYIHYMGLPPWLPIRDRGFGGLGLYQELSEP